MDEPQASTVMIAGSDARFIYLIRYYCKMSGCEAIVAPLDDVVTHATGSRPAVIVLESDPMNLGSGAALDRLKADAATHAIPVILCSWQDEDARALLHNADDYLQKPVSYEAFQTALQRATGLLP